MFYIVRICLRYSSKNLSLCILTLIFTFFQFTVRPTWCGFTPDIPLTWLLQMAFLLLSLTLTFHSSFAALNHFPWIPHFINFHSALFHFLSLHHLCMQCLHVFPRQGRVPEAAFSPTLCLVIRCPLFSCSLHPKFISLAQTSFSALNPCSHLPTSFLASLMWEFQRIALDPLPVTHVSVCGHFSASGTFFYPDAWGRNPRTSRSSPPPPSLIPDPSSNLLGSISRQLLNALAFLHCHDH